MAMSNSIEKADVIYRFLILGLHYGPSVMNFLSNDIVSTISKMYKKVSMEAHHYRGFIRFSELSNGVFCSRIRPDHNLLTMISPHFADRFPQENWMIIDEGRNIAVVHPAHKAWFLIDMGLVDEELLGEETEKEKEMQQSFRTFVENISIKERENYHLQRNMCPIRYREFMPEFVVNHGLG